MISKQLKELIHDFVKDGVILEKPDSMAGYEKLTDIRRLQFIRAYIDLLLNTTGIISPETKRYISNRYINVEGVARELNKVGKVHSIQTRIWRDLKKVEKLFGERMLVDVLNYDRIDMNIYEQKLEMARTDYTEVKTLDNIALKLPKCNGYTEVDEEQFNEFIIIVAPYTKYQMKYIGENIDRNVMAYVRRILSSTLLTDTDIERKERLQVLLGLGGLDISNS